MLSRSPFRPLLLNQNPLRVLLDTPVGMQQWLMKCKLCIIKTRVLVLWQPHINVIGCRWVFRTKLNCDGSLDRLKASFVAKGYSQQKGIDLIETFNPVIGPATIHTILTVATFKGWCLWQVNVKKCFSSWESRHIRIYGATTWLCLIPLAEPCLSTAVCPVWLETSPTGLV